MSNDSEMSARVSASICKSAFEAIAISGTIALHLSLVMQKEAIWSSRTALLTFRKRTEGYLAAAASISLLKAAHGSAHGAQKLRHETRLRSAERSSLKCSGEVTSTWFEDMIV